MLNEEIDGQACKDGARKDAKIDKDAKMQR